MNLTEKSLLSDHPLNCNSNEVQFTNTAFTTAVPRISFDLFRAVLYILQSRLTL
jgi:hypothetical protein